MVRTILNESPLLKSFWPDVVNITCYIMNKALMGPILNKTPYEYCFGRKPNISHFHIFGCKCNFHNNDKENLDQLILNLMKLGLLDILYLAKPFMYLIEGL